MSKPRALFNRHIREPLSEAGYINSRVQKKVNQASRQRSRSIRLSVLLVLLGASVFLWGLGYKLSQYGRQGYKIPEAKLVANNEDSSSAGDMQIPAVEDLTVDTILIAFVSIGAILAAVNVGPSLVGWMAAGEESGEPISIRLILSALFFRPPPIHSEF